MRLSEKRIQHLAKNISQKIVGQKTIEGTISTSNLTTTIAQTMIQYLRQEEDIDKEVRENLMKRKNLPPPGTGEYEALFSQEKQAVAKRRGYPL